MVDPSKLDTVEMPLPTGASGASALVEVDLAALSDRGKVRTNNEDHYLILRFGRLFETLFTNLPPGDVPSSTREIGYGMAVADGVGGSAAGEVASSLAIQTVVNLVLDLPDWILRPGPGLDDRVMRRAEERSRQVNDVLNEEAARNPKLRGMGTTMTIAWNLGADMFLAHVGDSRAYLYRLGQLHQLTRDHTLAQALADRGQIRQEDVASNRQRHVLTQTLGGGNTEVNPEVQHLHLADGDCILLCTDGLTEMVNEAAIADILARGESAETSCRRLVDLALKNGGKDNVTALLARYRFPQSA